MKSPALQKTIQLISDYFDKCKVGCFGTKGYRKTTDLSKFAACLDDLAQSGVLRPDASVFMDLGCGDGRVNLLAGYFVKLSIGIEVDPEILSEYEPRKKEAEALLERDGGLPPRKNIFLFPGSSLDAGTLREVRAKTGIAFEDVDLFYTYITLHDVFAEKIAERGRPGAFYLVYGFSRVLPRYETFELIVPDVGGQGIAALYRKKG